MPSTAIIRVRNCIHITAILHFLKPFDSTDATNIFKNETALLNLMVMFRETVHIFSENTNK